MNDKWYGEVKNIIATNKIPSTFVGHCCEIRQNIQIHKSNSVPLQRAKLRYDGYLHLPQLHILLPPPLHQCIDIHGFGKENNKDTPGILHGVVNQYCAAQCYEYDIVPDGSKCKYNVSTTKKSIEFKNIYGDKITHECYIETFFIDSDTDIKFLKHHDVSIENIKCSRLLAPPSFPQIWIILAKTSHNPPKCHIINIRWPPEVKSLITDLCSESLFRDSKLLLPNNGMDSTRTNGSNGLTTYANHNILALLKTKSAFIRKGKGVKLVKLPTAWHCFYISAGRQSKSQHIIDRSVSSWKYVQPQLGG